MRSMFYNDTINVLQVYEGSMSADTKEYKKETIRIGSGKSHAEEFAQMLDAQMKEIKTASI